MALKISEDTDTEYPEINTENENKYGNESERIFLFPAVEEAYQGGTHLIIHTYILYVYKDDSFICYTCRSKTRNSCKCRLQ